MPQGRIICTNARANRRILWQSPSDRITCGLHRRAVVRSNDFYPSWD